MRIFIPVVGQFTNIGDVLHRRELLSWLKSAGELHVYIGNAPANFVEGLKLDEKAILYADLRKWFWAIVKSKYKETAFVFNPGEIRLGKRRLLGELLLSPLLVLVKLKAGIILRVGIAAMSNYRQSNLWFWKLLFSTTTKIYWRTFHSQQLFNRGNVIPDLAFYDIQNNMPNIDQRNVLTLSMRGDKKLPSNKWFEAILQFSKQHKLTINVISQVRADNRRTNEIALKLNAKSYLWPDIMSHLEQEKILFDIYLNSKLIISDRLHVLIAAFSKGAMPANILSAPSEKVQHHFSVVGLNEVSILETEKTISELVSFLNDKIINSELSLNKLQLAKQKLEKTKTEILFLLKR
jgi:hypothetical protein